MTIFRPSTPYPIEVVARLVQRTPAMVRHYESKGVIKSIRYGDSNRRAYFLEDVAELRTYLESRGEQCLCAAGARVECPLHCTIADLEQRDYQEAMAEWRASAETVDAELAAAWESIRR